MDSSRSFIVLGIISRSVLICLWHKERVDVNFFSYRYPVDITPFVETYPFSIATLSKSTDRICLFLDSLYCSIDLKIYLFANTKLPWLLYVYKSQNQISPLTFSSSSSSSCFFFFLLLIALFILGLLYFQMNFRVSLSIFTHKNILLEFLLGLCWMYRYIW